LHGYLEQGILFRWRFYSGTFVEGGSFDDLSPFSVVIVIDRSGVRVRVRIGVRVRVRVRVSVRV